MDLALGPEAELDTDRVRRHTAPHVNQRIDSVMRTSVAAAVDAGPEAVRRRLTQLEYEWDVDRALMVNFAVAGGASFALGMLRYSNSHRFGAAKKGFLYFFGTQLAFLLVHGVVGWCPPASVFRRLGFRTQREIDVERAALREALPKSKALGA